MDRVKMVSLFVIALFLTAMIFGTLVVHANGDEEDDEGDEEEEDENEFAQSLGEFAWNVTPFLVVGFSLYRFAYLRQSRLGFRLPIKYRYVLDFHIYSSILLGVIALVHGAMFIDYATPLEYAIGAVILTILVTGILLRWSRDRRVKMFARLLHTQRLLAIILFVLVAIHVGVVED